MKLVHFYFEGKQSKQLYKVQKEDDPGCLYAIYGKSDNGKRELLQTCKLYFIPELGVCEVTNINNFCIVKKVIKTKKRIIKKLKKFLKNCAVVICVTEKNGICKCYKTTDAETVYNSLRLNVKGVFGLCFSYSVLDLQGWEQINFIGTKPVPKNIEEFENIEKNLGNAFERFITGLEKRKPKYEIDYTEEGVNYELKHIYYNNASTNLFECLTWNDLIEE